MKTLTYNQRVRTTMDEYQPTITIGSVEGYAKQYANCPAMAYIQNMIHASQNRWTRYDAAWANKAGAMLTNQYQNDPVGRAAAIAKAEQDYNDATLIEDGDFVIIEGRTYQAKYTNPRVSDPIHFNLITN